MTRQEEASELFRQLSEKERHSLLDMMRSAAALSGVKA